MDDITPQQCEPFQCEVLRSFNGGIWDWDMVTGTAIYSAEWANLLGYTLEELSQTADSFERLVFSEDRPYIKEHLRRYLAGESTQCEARFRMNCKNKTLIWVQAKGYVTAYDDAGNPTRFLGALENIMHHTDSPQRLEKQLSDALESLEKNNLSIESTAVRHQLEMKEQNELLQTISKISKKLLDVKSDHSFENKVQDCLQLLGESLEKNRVYIWKDYIDEAGVICCTQLYEWIRGAVSIQGNAQFEGVSYETMPSVIAAIKDDRCLNCTLAALSNVEQDFLRPQGIKSILIAPIAINGTRWGFIGVDNCENEMLFTRMEETMLLMSGSLLASTIDKIDTEAALREMEERSKIMLNATPLCYNLWTSEFQNVSCNDEAVRLFELSSQQEYLDRFYELSPEYQPCGTSTADLSVAHITKAFEEGYHRFEWLHQKLDGTKIPSEITLVRIKHRDNYIVAGYTRDLREEKEMLLELKTKEALRQARDEALLNSKAKSNFLANMSHEIRTPMNAISGFSEIIVRECIQENVREYAIGIRNACNNLINLINDILDISKIESGKLEVYNTPYALSSLLNDVITISQMRLGTRPLRLVTNIDSHLPAQLVGDETRIRQVFLNLLSNAIKYTQKGYIVLNVSGTIKDNQVMLCFSVKDSGIGIKEEDLAKLFDEFERINTTKVRHIEGTGLGLAISKQLCEMMGGHIEVESTFGHGSEFTVFIPQKCPNYEPLAQVLESKRVLLYEPRQQYRTSIVQSVQNLDCSCVACKNLKELRESLCDLKYDYLLTPVMHLKDVQSILLKEHKSIPVAAFADYGKLVRDDSICTLLFPINCIQLSALLNGQHIEDNRPQSKKAGKQFVAPSARVLVVDDNSVNQQVAKGLMEPYLFAVDTAANGVEAVNMVQNTKYDLVFMDHMMSEMDGVDATIAIRALEGMYYQNLPIVALTANALVGMREMFIRNGMNDFLSKPIELNKLTQMLLKWLPQSKIKSITSVIDEGGSGKWSMSRINGIDMEQGLVYVGGKEENYLQILAAYYTDSIKKSIILSQHLENKDIAAFQTEIHSLKSASASIGAKDLSRFAEKLEIAAQHKDLDYISSRFNEFLLVLQAIIEGISPHLSQPEDQPSDEEIRDMGTQTFLIEALDQLQHAAEFFQIRELEDILNKLQSFKWSVEIEEELYTIQKYLDIFDYDGIVKCVNRLNH